MNELKQETSLESFLGKMVTVIVDRPVGTIHPKYDNIIYPINYGHIDGVIASDGEAQDVYILGINKPVKEFFGRVIAIIHRHNGTEDKLVVAPEGMKYNQAEIMEQVYFQEQFFAISITCLYHKSCGAIIYRKIDGNIQYLLLFQHNSQTWSCPKGHAEAYESELQAASREVKEETGLDVRFISGFRETITYPISDKCEKEVVLFLAEATNDIYLPEKEIQKYMWVDKQNAIKLLARKAYADIFDKIERILKVSG